MGWGILEPSRLPLRPMAAIFAALGVLAGCSDPAPVMLQGESRTVEHAAQDARSEKAIDTILEPTLLLTPDRSRSLDVRQAVSIEAEVPERRTEPDGEGEKLPAAPVPPEENKPAFTVRIEPSSLTLSTQESAPLRADLLDSQGRVIQSHGAIWWSSDRRIASVTSDGMVTALSAGTATISASIGGIQGDLLVKVEWTPIARLEIRSPVGSEVLVGSLLQLSTIAREASGQVLLDRGAPIWTSDRPDIASIDSNGLLVAHAPGVAKIRAVVDEAEAKLEIHSVLRFTQLSAGSTHTCGIATTGDAWCWGTGSKGELGIGYATSAPIPAKVGGELTFLSISSRASHTCALVVPTEIGNAVCWGRGTDGRLGTGGDANEWFPAWVTGGISFDQISAGTSSTCGIVSGGRGYCWGTETGTSSPDPVPALEGFESILLGSSQAIGVWSGELLHFLGKDGAQAMSGSSPDPVPARVLIPSLKAEDMVQSYALSERHACATLGATLAESKTWCWGEGWSGQLGGGKYEAPESAVEVVGVEGLTGLVAGTAHTCGLTASGEAWCWGSNSFGQLGAATDAGRSSVPLAVAGPRFSSLASGANHTCGISVSGEAWCWGRNSSSQLGDGTKAQMNFPVLVSSQH